MLKLHNKNVERNGLSMDNIMLHGEVDALQENRQTTTLLTNANSVVKDYNDY